jgi:bifunctional UDP-N-acetylglucosamine pyrophosphorylase/glucosamine-1-phosphate N-acetyltransferase
MLRERNERVLAEVAADARELLGCNTRAHLADVDRIFRARNAAALMESGVTIYLPETVMADPGVTAGPDTVIEPGVQLLGDTRIGARCTIRTGSVLQNVRVDDDVVIGAHSTLDSSSFVEMKNTVLREGSKAPHLSYLGDASIGRDTNVGAGTITCNYDGVAKHPTTIGSRVFIGSDTALVAPVRIGDGAYVAAGSVITENVPAEALGIARGRQVNKPGWAAARRKEMQRGAKSKSSAAARKSARRRSKSRVKAKSSRPAKRSKRH